MTFRISLAVLTLLILAAYQEGKPQTNNSYNGLDLVDKPLPLSLDEFLRRFLLHLLPQGFVRIRNFGFLANRRRATTLPLCFQLLGPAPQAKPEVTTASSSDAWLCPKCGGPMLVIERLTAAEIQLRSPPTQDAAAA